MQIGFKRRSGTVIFIIYVPIVRFHDYTTGLSRFGGLTEFRERRGDVNDNGRFNWRGFSLRKVEVSAFFFTSFYKRGFICLFVYKFLSLCLIT